MESRQPFLHWHSERVQRPHQSRFLKGRAWRQVSYGDVTMPASPRGGGSGRNAAEWAQPTSGQTPARGMSLGLAESEPHASVMKEGIFSCVFLKVPFEMLIQSGPDLQKLHAYQFTSSTSMNSLFHYLSDLIRLLNLAGSFNLNENSSKDWCQLSFPPHCNYHIWVGSGCTASSARAAVGLLCLRGWQQQRQESGVQTQEQHELLQGRQTCTVL